MREFVFQKAVNGGWVFGKCLGESDAFLFGPTIEDVKGQIASAEEALSVAAAGGLSNQFSAIDEWTVLEVA